MSIKTAAPSGQHNSWIGHKGPGGFDLRSKNGLPNLIPIPAQVC
jgi:hypothetical protein